MSLSSNGSILAVGAPGDNETTGATIIFVYDGCTYKQLSGKLVGKESSPFSYQGKGMAAYMCMSYSWIPRIKPSIMVWPSGSSVMLSSDGRFLAVGAPEAPYGNNLVGATWIFVYNGSTYQQFGNILVGNDASTLSKQGRERAPNVMRHILGHSIHH